MLFARGQKIKNITEIEQKRLFLFTILISFFMTFLLQKRNVRTQKIYIYPCVWLIF